MSQPSTKKATYNSTQEEMLKRSPPCDCAACNHGCTMGAGFLADEDIKPLAEFLKVTTKELKEKYLDKKHFLNKDVYRPKLIRKVNQRTGRRNPYGQCIFFKENKCSIHPVKPLECKLAMPCKPYGEEQTTWFMLRKILNTNNDQAIQEYDTYLKAGGKTLPLASIAKLIPDKKKRDKILRKKYEK